MQFNVDPRPRIPSEFRLRRLSVSARLVDIAVRAGCSQSLISQWERGGRVSAETATRLEAALDSFISRC